MRLVACGQFRSQGLQLLMRLRLRSVERRRLNVPLAPCGLNDQFLLRRAAGGQFRSQLLLVMQPMSPVWEAFFKPAYVSLLRARPRKTSLP